jgi:nitroreductase
MEFDHVVQKRKMIRKYLPNKIPDRIISKLIKNASRAPSAGHTQVQEFIIVRDPTTKKKLRQASINQKVIEEASLLIVVCSNTSRSVGRYGQRVRDFYSILDGAFSSMLILLTAVNEEIGAGFVGAFEDNKVAKILELPEYVKPIGIIALGYPDESPAKLERIQNEQIVHYEHW